MSNTPTAEMPPRLAPPGAGLPALELMAARLLFAVLRRRTSPAAAAQVIETECGALVACARRLDPRAAATRVLIRRLRCLEDSSRHWSVLMVLEHLRIVNTAVAATITTLAAGQVPAHQASTAAVKPGTEVDAAVIDAFAESCHAIRRAADAAGDLRTEARYAHPWFGPLNAASWHVMAGMHMRLHRRQIDAILRELNQAPCRI